MESFRRNGTDDSKGWWNGLNRRTLLKAGAAGVAGGTLMTSGVVAKSIDVGDDDAGDSENNGAGMDDEEWDDLSLREQLKTVRKATKQYRDLEAAGRDEYVSAALPLICGIGYHFDKESLWEEPSDPERPGSLFYVVDNGRLKLGGVEYLFITELDDEGNPVDPMPELFADEDEPIDEEPLSGVSEADAWELIEDPATGLVVWNLHAWVHLDNPNGVFEHEHPGYENIPGCVPLEDLL